MRNSFNRRNLSGVKLMLNHLKRINCTGRQDRRRRVKDCKNRQWSAIDLWPRLVLAGLIVSPPSAKKRTTADAAGVWANPTLRNAREGRAPRSMFTIETVNEP